VNVLLDENLSPTLVDRLAQIGVHARAVAHIGLAGTLDHVLFEYAYRHDFVVVTINVQDFLELAAGTDVHPGLIVIRVSGLDPNEQWAHIEPAVRAFLAIEEDGGSTVN